MEVKISLHGPDIFDGFGILAKNVATNGPKKRNIFDAIVILAKHFASIKLDIFDVFRILAKHVAP